jgi:1,4-dihydroxy-2-naphthoyl-CoA hydrolase
VNVDDQARETAQIAEAMPFLATLGATVEALDESRIVLRLNMRASLCTTGGALHGGVLMSLADTAGGILAFRVLPAGALGTTTIASSTSFLRRADGHTGVGHGAAHTQRTAHDRRRYRRRR